ncbi:hypothetical protein OIU78_009652 [Salix suchowensis]|nr:hypothetical protein OIU78_009652 [Salix suchowensis]KAJ6341534.1 hypothetical protein OIU78_009652 [Salix suchowensis]
MDLNSCCCIYYHRNPTNSHYFNRIPTFLSNPPRQNHSFGAKITQSESELLTMMVSSSKLCLS